MAARNQLLDDLVLRRAQPLVGFEHLLVRGDVVALAGQKVSRTRDVVQPDLAAERHEVALAELVVLEDVPDGLQVPAARQVERVFVPARELVALFQERRVFHVFIQVDVVLEIVHFRMHRLPPGKHELAAHQAAAHFDQAFEEAHRFLFGDVLDEAVTGVGIERRTGGDEARGLLGITRSEHAGHPAALAEADQIHLAAQIVDIGVDAGEVAVDVEIRVFDGCRLPVRDQDAAQSARHQCLDQTLPLGVVGDGRGVAGIGRVDQGRNDSLIGAHLRVREVAQAHDIAFVQDVVS